MDPQISQLIRELLDPTSRMDHNSIISAIVKIGEPAVEPLITEMKASGYKGRRATLYKVFKEMGYPLNEPALSFAVGAIQDVNLPGWDDAAAIILQAGEEALPHIRDMLMFYVQEPTENGFEIQGIVGLLDDMAPKIVNELKFEITELEKAQPSNSPMKGWVNEILQKIKYGQE